MTIYRTIKKLRDCMTCQGTGQIWISPDKTGECGECHGTGQIDVYSRVSRAAAVRAEAATKQLPPRSRQAARERLQDHEAAFVPEEEPLPSAAKEGKVGKESKVGKDFIEEA